MTRFLGILSVLLVVLLAMAFAAGNAGQQVTLHLGIMTLYRVPITLVAFGGLLMGMLVMFSTGIYTDLKVRKVLRDRLAEESRKEQGWIDRNQRDLFAETDEAGGEAVEADGTGEDPEMIRAGADEDPKMIRTVPAMDTPQPAEPVPGASTQPTPAEYPAVPEESAEGYQAEKLDQEETRTE